MIVDRQRHAVSCDIVRFVRRADLPLASAGTEGLRGSHQVIPMVNVPDDITLERLCRKAAEALARAGLDRRIDIYREVEIDDPAVRLMLGRPHRLRVRVKITAASLLFDTGEDQPEGAAAAVEPMEGNSEFGDLGPGAPQSIDGDVTP